MYCERIIATHRRPLVVVIQYCDLLFTLIKFRCSSYIIVACSEVLNRWLQYALNLHVSGCKVSSRARQTGVARIIFYIILGKATPTHTALDIALGPLSRYGCLYFDLSLLTACAFYQVRCDNNMYEKVFSIVPSRMQYSTSTLSHKYSLSFLCILYASAYTVHVAIIYTTPDLVERAHAYKTEVKVQTAIIERSRERCRERCRERSRERSLWKFILDRNQV